MTLPELTYLTTDSVSEGIGASQVSAYVGRLAERGLRINLHTFEKRVPERDMRMLFAERGVTWTPHPFGRLGGRGGVARVLTGAAAIRGAELVHARSDLAAASALLSRHRLWLWDIRSLWAEERIVVGALRRGSPEHRVMRRIEAASATRSSAVVTLAAAALPVLEEQHGISFAEKATVIPTCVDLARFALAPMPEPDPLRLLLAGTMNAYYDVPLMTRFVTTGQRRRPATLALLAPDTTAWEHVLGSFGVERASARPEDVPGHLAGAHVGLSVCKADAGVSLSARMPTKIGEFLAVGRPVVVNAGLGDADVLVEEARAGIVLRDLSDEGLEEAWDALERLLADPETPQRCRALAEQHFDLDVGVDKLIGIYNRMMTA